MFRAVIGVVRDVRCRYRCGQLEGVSGRVGCACVDCGGCTRSNIAVQFKQDVDRYCKAERRFLGDSIHTAIRAFDLNCNRAPYAQVTSRLCAPWSVRVRGGHSWGVRSVPSE